MYNIQAIPFSGLFLFYYKNILMGWRDSLQLRAFDALVEDQSWGPRMTYGTTCISDSVMSGTLF